MAGRIPQPFIDDLLARVDIVEIIDARVPLKKTGREFTACCPFHDEKTPSFTVSPTKQFYHCFGCGAHGTAISFLMEYEHVGFREAIEELAGGIGLALPATGDSTPGTAASNQPLFDVLQQAAVFYWQQWRTHPGATTGIEYLKGRGVNDAVVRDYRIGFAPAEWRALVDALSPRHGSARLLEAGLAAEKNGRHYDRFRDRIMFPIRDYRGRVIAFGGRILGSESAESGPKYLNSPETAVFHKGRELYGLYEARQALRKLPRLLVVEGYMDVVSLAQFGVRYAVATLGTAVTADHLERLFRTTSEVVFCFDGDRAGRAAAWRGLENALPLMRDGRQLRFMFLADGEDPDTLIRRIGAEAFEQQIAQAEPLSEFLIKGLMNQVDLSSIDGQARLIELARPLLSNLPEGVYRQMVANELAAVARLRNEQANRLAGQAPAKSARSTRARPRPGDSRRAPSLVRRAIELLLHRPELAARVPNPRELEGVPQPGARLLMEMIELLTGNPHLTTAGIVEHWRETPEGRHLGQLAAGTPVLPEETEYLEEEFVRAVAALVREKDRQRKQELEKRFHALTEQEKRELQGLMSKLKVR